VLQSDVWDSAYEGVFWVKLNTGGTIAAGGGWLTSTYVGQLRAISVSDGSVLLTQSTGSRVNTIAMSADGTILAAGCGATYSGSGQQIYLYSLQNNAYQPLTGLTSSNNSVQSLAMSADGQWLVAGFYPNGSAPALILFQITSTAWCSRRPGPSRHPAARWRSRRKRTRGHGEGAFRGAGQPWRPGGIQLRRRLREIRGNGRGWRQIRRRISGTNGIYCFDRETFIQGGAASWQYIQPASAPPAAWACRRTAPSWWASATAARPWWDMPIA